jgi:peptidoglycan/LPS O-acetylase OafA/YrhL
VTDADTARRPAGSPEEPAKSAEGPAKSAEAGQAGESAEAGESIDRVDPIGQLSRGYLHQVDVVRLLTFGSVIVVHIIAALTAPESLSARGVLMLLHFTRETFFVITGFVLFHSAYRRVLRVGPFWRRRFLLIGVPYLTWSAIYWAEHVLIGTDHGRLTAAGLRSLGFQLVIGTAEYHLYFLLVSMQVYLVFPWLVRVVRRAEGRHGRLLAASALVQLITFWFLHDGVQAWTGRPGWVSTLVGYAQQVLPSYQFYVIAGALAAVHLDRVNAWVLGHLRQLAVALAVGAMLTEGWFGLQVRFGTPVSHASEVLQPVMVPWTLLVSVGLLALGLRYALRRHRQKPAVGPLGRAVREGARISFGVFLVHPLVITLLLPTPIGALAAIPGQPWTTAVLWVATVVCSVAVVELAAHSPLSLPLTGRRRPRRSRRKDATPSRAAPASATPSRAAPAAAAPTDPLPPNGSTDGRRR